MRMRIYTDGSSTGGVGDGGWAFLVIPEVEAEEGLLFSGYEADTTNNQMELLAIVRALEYCLQEVTDSIEIVSDSEYAINVLSGKYHPTKNLDLVHRGRRLVTFLKPRFTWVRGHNGDALNELVDKAAKEAKSQGPDRADIERG